MSNRRSFLRILLGLPVLTAVGVPAVAKCKPLPTTIVINGEGLAPHLESMAADIFKEIQQRIHDNGATFLR